jgi:hypothetical protein
MKGNNYMWTRFLLADDHKRDRMDLSMKQLYILLTLLGMKDTMVVASSWHKIKNRVYAGVRYA